MRENRAISAIIFYDKACRRKNKLCRTNNKVCRTSDKPCCREFFSVNWGIFSHALPYGKRSPFFASNFDMKDYIGMNCGFYRYI